MKKVSMQLNSEYLTLLFDPRTGLYNILSDTMMLKDIRCYFVLFAGQRIGFKPGKTEIEITENTAKLYTTGKFKLFFEAALLPDSSYLTCRLNLTNQSKREIFLDRAVLLDCGLPDEMSDQLVALKNSYCSGEPSPVTPVNAHGTEDERDEETGTLSSEVFTSIRDLRRRHQITLGFSSQAEFLSHIRLKRNRLLAECDLGWMRVPPGATVTSEELSVDLTTGPEALLSYGSLLKQRMKVDIPKGLGLGFQVTSDNPARLSEGKVLRILKELSTHRNELPIDFVLVSDGCRKEVNSDRSGSGDSIVSDDRFPHGLGWLAERIKEAGFRPGLCLTPFIISRSSRLFEEHPDWPIRDMRENPKPITEWGDEPAYALDTTQPAVQEWLKNIFRTLAEDWGYQVFEIDHAYAGAEIGKRFDQRAGRVQAYRKGLEIIREAIGQERHLIATGAPIGPSVGLVDAVRFTSEAEMAKPGTKGRTQRTERPDSLNNTYSRWFMNQNFWFNYPDPIPIGTDKGAPLLSEVEARATLVALTGELQVVTCNSRKLDPERIQIIRKIHPPYGGGGRVVNLFGERYPWFIYMPIETDFDRWILLGAFNWSDEPADMSISLNRLGFKGSEEHHLFDFWKERYVGRIKNNVVIRKLPPKSTRLLRITRIRKRAQLIACPLHFTQGAVEVRHFRPDVDRVEVRVESELASEVKLWLHDPARTRPLIVKIPTNQDHLIKLTPSDRD